jgi:hypothetical protein
MSVDLGAIGQEPYASWVTDLLTRMSGPLVNIGCVRGLPIRKRAQRIAALLCGLPIVTGMAYYFLRYEHISVLWLTPLGSRFLVHGIISEIVWIGNKGPSAESAGEIAQPECG